MIEPTDEMLVAWRDAMAAKAAELVSAGAPLGSSKEVARAGLAAVLSIVERDHKLTWRTCAAERRGAGNVCQAHGCVYPGELPGVGCRELS